LDRCLINGVESNSLSVTDRGLNYADGLFETIAVRAGQCRFLDAHLDRLAEGCERLRIPPPDRQNIMAELEQLLAGAEHATVKITITRGSGPRGYQLPVPCSPTRILALQKTQPLPAIARGVRARYCTTLLSRNPSLAGLKTLNCLEQVLARSEWDDADIAEGLMLNDRGEVVCGTMSNLFFTRTGVLFTPPLDECGVSGIMRNTILQVVQSLGIAVKEAAVSKAALQNADDIFLSNALIGIWPVVELVGQTYRRSAVTERIMKGLSEKGVIECGT
jgi:4-amino-4-deoxychorismate lyase